MGNTIVATIFLLAAIAAILSFAMQFWIRPGTEVGGTQRLEASDPQSPLSGEPSSDAEAIEHEFGAPLRAGTCLAEGELIVPCSATHSMEVFESPECSLEAMREYMGASAIDVLGDYASVSVLVFQENPYCVVNVSPGIDLTLRSILLSAYGDRFRACADRRTGQDLPCSEPHTTEVVFTGSPPAGSDLDCVERADQYLDRPVKDLVSYLKVIASPGAVSTCSVEIRGDNYLIASLRGIRESALPLG